MSKKTLTFVIIVLVVIAGLIYWNKHPKTTPVEDPNSISTIDSQTQADTTAQMQADLNSVDTSAGIDSDLNSVDTKIQAL